MLDGTLLESVLAENGEYIQWSLSLSHVTDFLNLFDVEEESLSDVGQKGAEPFVDDEDTHGIIINDNVLTEVKLTQTTSELT